MGDVCISFVVSKPWYVRLVWRIAKRLRHLGFKINFEALARWTIKHSIRIEHLRKE